LPTCYFYVSDSSKNCVQLPKSLDHGIIDHKSKRRYLSFMKAIPGTLQEGGASFQTTHWTLVLQAGQGEPSESRQKALSLFCESYWPPLYAFLRHRRVAPADAQDLVQAFFVHLFEKNILEHADREKGRLRTFLLSPAVIPCPMASFILRRRQPWKI
jgi:Sigma-70 region 2